MTDWCTIEDCDKRQLGPGRAAKSFDEIRLDRAVKCSALNIEDLLEICFAFGPDVDLQHTLAV